MRGAQSQSRPRSIRMLALWCALAVAMTPASQLVHQREVAAEPISLAVIGIAVSLAGIATDVYGMTRENDVAGTVTAKVEQTVKAQLKIGLSPLRSINPKLKKLLAGQRDMKAQLTKLTTLVSTESARTRKLLKALHRENLSQHRKTQRLVVGLQDARYGAALRLIDLGGKSLKSNPEQASKLFNEALTALLETQSYHRLRIKAGSYVSREYRALIHLSLATCYRHLQPTCHLSSTTFRFVLMGSTSMEVRST